MVSGEGLGKEKELRFSVALVSLLAGLTAAGVMSGLAYLRSQSGLPSLERYPEHVVVGEVVDGDTLRVREVAPRQREFTVRLLGVDAPEQGEAGYAAARRFVAGLVLDQPVRLEYEREKEDRYYRVLAYVWVYPVRDEASNEAEEMNLAVELVRQDLAQVYVPQDQNLKYEEELREAAKEVKNAK